MNEQAARRVTYNHSRRWPNRIHSSRRGGHVSAVSNMGRMRNTVLGVAAAVTCALLMLAWRANLDDSSKDVPPVVQARIELPGAFYLSIPAEPWNGDLLNRQNQKPAVSTELNSWIVEYRNDRNCNYGNPYKRERCTLRANQSL